MRIWVITLSGQRYLPRTLLGGILCNIMGLHSWKSDRVRTIAEISSREGDHDRLPKTDFESKRLHHWVCRRDYCDAEFDSIGEHRDRELAAQRDAVARFMSR